MSKYEHLIKELEAIRAEVLPGTGNPYNLNDQEKEDCRRVINTLIFIVQHIDKLKSKKDTYFLADPGDTGAQQLDKYAPLHFNDIRYKAQKAVERELKREQEKKKDAEALTLSAEQLEKRIQDAVEYTLITSTVQWFIDSFRSLKAHQAKMDGAKVTVNVIKEFFKKLHGNCMDTRQAAMEYATTITEGPRFSEMFRVTDEVPPKFKFSYFGTYAIILKKQFGRAFRPDQKHPSPELQICNREGVFSATDYVSELVRRQLIDQVGLIPMKPLKDLESNEIEDPYYHFVLAFQGLETEELRDHMVRFLLSHGDDFVNEFLKGFEKTFIDNPKPKFAVDPIDICAIAMRLDKVDWISTCLRSETNALKGEVLILAAVRHDRKTFLAIIDAGFPLTEKINRKTPIEIAAQAECWNCVSDIIRRRPLDERDEAHYGCALLHVAKQRKWKEDVFKELLEAKATPDWSFPSTGYFALHYALLEEEFLPIAQMLLDPNADINLQRKKTPNPAPIHVVAKNKEAKLAALKWVLEQKADIDRKDSNDDTALNLAAESGQADKVLMLLDQGADLKAVNKQGNSALMLAAANGHIEVVQRLMQRGATTKMLCELNHNRKHAFDILAEKGNWSAFIAIARLCHADLHSLLRVQNAEQRSIIAIASRLNAWDCVSDLLDMNPSVTSDPKDETHLGMVLELAGRNKKWSIFRKIINIANETVDYMWGDINTGYSTFHHALFEPEEEFKGEPLAQLLLNMDPELVNVKSDKKPNPAPLHVAAGKKEVTVKIFQLLLDQKDLIVECRDDNNNTALMLAAVTGQLDKVNMLLKALLTRNPHTNLDVVNMQGNSALMLAALNGHVDVVQALVRSGASPHMLYTLNVAGKHVFDILAEKSRWTAFSAFVRLYHVVLPTLLTTKNLKGLTLIQLAAQGSAFDCVSDIIDMCQSDVDDKMHSGYALVQATSNFKWHIAEKILRVITSTAVNPQTSFTWKTTSLGYYALHYAIHQKKEEYKGEPIAQQLLNAGADPNCHSKSLRSHAPIHLAAALEVIDTSMLKLLLDHKEIKVNLVVDRDLRETALHFAVRTGQIEKVKLLLAHPDCDIEVRRKDGKTSLQLAQEFKLADILALFDSDSVRFKVIKNRINREQYDAASNLLLVIYNNNRETFKECFLTLQDLLGPVHVDGNTAYQKLLSQLIPVMAKQLITNNDISKLGLLLQTCNDTLLNAKICDGESMLQFAARLDRKDIVSGLLVMGAKPENDIEAQYLAAKMQDWSGYQELLLRQYCDPKTGFTALHVAITYNDIETANAVLERDAQLLAEVVNLEDSKESGITIPQPLIMAIENDKVNFKTFEWLLNKYEQSAFKFNLHLILQNYEFIAPANEKTKLFFRKQMELGYQSHRFFTAEIQQGPITACPTESVYISMHHAIL